MPYSVDCGLLHVCGRTGTGTNQWAELSTGRRVSGAITHGDSKAQILCTGDTEALYILQEKFMRVGVKCECADVTTCNMRTDIADIFADVTGKVWRCGC